MSIITGNTIGQVLQSNEYYSFDVKQHTNSAAITMIMLTSYVTTAYTPQAHSILKKRLPSIMRSKCFNENNYAFPEEVKNTEIGHLFEHIILEHLSQLKLSQGVKNPVYNGLTSWNWAKKERGVFHIEIDAGLEDKEIFGIAVQMSSKLLNEILRSVQKEINEYDSTLHPNFLPLSIDESDLL